MEELLKTAVPVALAIGAGIIGGNGAVYAFNRMPARWLCDYGEEPSEELLDKGSQRIKSYPWKPALSMLFVVAAIYLFEKDIFYGVPVLAAMWLLLEIAMADKKYGIIPDQLVMLLAITAFGFVPYGRSPQNMLLGALLGGGCMLLVSLCGRIIFKKDVMGFGDVKLFGAAGLLLGVVGTASVLMATSILSCVAYGILILRKKIKKGDEQPLGPYIAATTALYLMFFNI